MTDRDWIYSGKNRCMLGTGGQIMNNALFSDVEYLRLLNIHEMHETFFGVRAHVFTQSTIFFPHKEISRVNK